MEQPPDYSEPSRRLNSPSNSAVNLQPINSFNSYNPNFNGYENPNFNNYENPNFNNYGNPNFNDRENPIFNSYENPNLSNFSDNPLPIGFGSPIRHFAHSGYVQPANGFNPCSPNININNYDSPRPIGIVVSAGPLTPSCYVQPGNPYEQSQCEPIIPTRPGCCYTPVSTSDHPAIYQYSNSVVQPGPYFENESLSCCAAFCIFFFIVLIILVIVGAIQNNF